MSLKHFESFVRYENTDTPCKSHLTSFFLHLTIGNYEVNFQANMISFVFIQFIVVVEREKPVLNAISSFTNLRALFNIFNIMLASI